MHPKKFNTGQERSLARPIMPGPKIHGSGAGFGDPAILLKSKLQA
jgi:hypothetical protein